MQKVKAKTLAGFMELTPQKQVLFNQMKSVIAQTFESNGLTPMDTPVLEYSSVLLAKAGGETEKQVYRFEKGDADLCMRFDLTVPFAKYVALNHNELTFPFRRYQIGKVYRGERAQKGRLREFYQCDMDIISNGELDIRADAECIDVMSQVFANLGLEAIIRVNNRKLINGVLNEYSLQNSASEILNILDKKDKIGKEKTLELLSAHTQNAKRIFEFSQIRSLEKLREQGINNNLFAEGVNELEELFEILKAKKTSAEVVFDFGIIRGLDYYTGTVFEANLKCLSEKTSVGGGGRYDNLAGLFTEEKFVGVGVSVGLSRIFDLLDKNNLLDFRKKTTSVLAIVPFEDVVFNSFEIENRFRKAGIAVENLYARNKSFKNKLNYVNKAGIDFMIVLGENEISSKVLNCKSMQSGETYSGNIDEIISYIKNHLNAK